MAESMHRDPDHSQRIWAGDQTALVQSHEKFLTDPEGQFVAYMSDLYAFRDRPLARSELIAFTPEILERSHPDALFFRSVSPREYADRADVLSAILAWMPGEQSRSLRETSLTLAKDALRMCPRTPGGHTEMFLAIRAAVLTLEINGTSGLWEACNLLDLGTWLVARRVRDRNQRARVYRALADFHRRTAKMGLRSGWIFAGCYFLAALLVPGIPWDVRRKTFRALWAH